MAMPQASPISNPLQRLRFAATKPAVKLPAQRETQPIAATSSSEASILLINRENNSNSSNTTASPASTASTVLQTGDCQQVRRTGRFLQGGGGGQAHFATAGGKNADGLNAAIDKVLELAGL